MNRIEPKTLPGFMELLPAEQILFNQMIDTIKCSYEKFGFLPLDTPIIESADVVLAKAGGETEKQIYKFNKGENDLALRFDLTVPLAKFVALYYNELSFPFRRYQIGKVYRGEKPQKGRYREFYQCDIDIVGDGELNIVNDAEMPSIIYTTFKDLGFDDFTIYINNRKLFSGLFEYLELKEYSTDIMRIIDKIDKIGEEVAKEEIEKLGIDPEKIKSIMSFISISGSTDEKIKLLKELNINNEIFNIGLNELEDVAKKIRLFGVPEEFFKINLKIARGLDYYTGTIYETFLNKYEKIGSICSGGRYENLAEYYTDKKLPGVGVSIGFTRLFYILNEMNLIKARKKSISDVLVIPMDEKIEDSLKLATYLRQNNINTEVYTDDKKPKAKLKYANKINVPYVILIGEEERKDGMYTLKNMETGEQEKLNKENILSKLRKK